MSNQALSPVEPPHLTGIHTTVQQREIRLLKLLRGELQDPIHCNLIHTSLDGHPPYEALSYAWGCGIRSCKILINRQDFRITQNLSAALTRLRSQTDDRLLWIDAICINQNDIPERNAQVAQMQTVYKNATNILVWLGEEEDQSEVAIQFLRDFRDNAMSPEWVQNTLLHAYHLDTYEALWRLLNRPYWNRLWVVQEIAFAKTAHIFCGNSSVSYDVALKACKIFDDVCVQKFDRSDLNMAKLRSWFGNVGPNNLPEPGHARTSARASILDVMIQYASKAASNPCDKVYGLIGLSSIDTNLEQNIPIDYEIPVGEVYKRFVWAVVKRTQKVDFLSQCGQNDPTLHGLGDEQADLPSWIPDWRRVMRPQPFGHKLPEISAGGSENAETVFSEDGTTLTVKGFCLGSIDICGLTYLIREEFEKKNNAILDLVCCVLQWRELCWHLSTDKEWQDIFYRMLLMGMDCEFINDEELKAFWNEWEVDFPHSRYRSKKTSSVPALTFMSHVLDGRFMFLSLATTTGAQPGTRESDSNTKPSSSGAFGLAPSAAREGDLICVILGCKCPLVLRRIDRHYVVVGEAFVNAHMQGQVIEEAAKGFYKLQSFALR